MEGLGVLGGGLRGLEAGESLPPPPHPRNAMGSSRNGTNMNAINLFLINMAPPYPFFINNKNLYKRFDKPFLKFGK